MNDFLANAGVFLGVVLLFVVLMVADTWRRLDDWSLSALREYFSKTEGGDGALPGIALAVAVPLLLALALTFFYSQARAGISYVDHTIIYAGLDGTAKQSPQCRSDGMNDRLTSNLGVKQHLIGYKDVSIYGSYTHHSCAVNRDRNSYDGFGLQVQWVIGNN